MSKPSFNSTLPEVAQSIRGEQGRIGYLLRQANLAHHVRVEKILAEFNLTLPQYSVLSILELYPGASNADLARICLLTPQTTLVIVKNLEKMELIRRQPHLIHGRIQQNDLTSKGQALLNEATKKVLVFQKELIKGFTLEEEKIIRRWLVNLAGKEEAV